VEPPFDTLSNLPTEESPAYFRQAYVTIECFITNVPPELAENGWKGWSQCGENTLHLGALLNQGVCQLTPQAFNIISKNQYSDSK